jgi:hypothetical protein
LGASDFGTNLFEVEDWRKGAANGILQSSDFYLASPAIKSLTIFKLSLYKRCLNDNVIQEMLGTCQLPAQTRGNSQKG